MGLKHLYISESFLRYGTMGEEYNVKMLVSPYGNWVRGLGILSEKEDKLLCHAYLLKWSDQE